MNEELTPVDWEALRDKANAVFQKTMEDIEIMDQRRRRLFSDAWFIFGELELGIQTYKDRSFVWMLERTDEETFEVFDYVATDPVTSEPDAEIWFELENGQMDLHKRINTVPACVALKIVEQFVKTGERLSSVTWVRGNTIS